MSHPVRTAAIAVLTGVLLTTPTVALARSGPSPQPSASELSPLSLVPDSAAPGQTIVVSMLTEGWSESGRIGDWRVSSPAFTAPVRLSGSKASGNGHATIRCVQPGQYPVTLTGTGITNPDGGKLPVTTTITVSAGRTPCGTPAATVSSEAVPPAAIRSTATADARAGDGSALPWAAGGTAALAALFGGAVLTRRRRR